MSFPAFHPVACAKAATRVAELGDALPAPPGNPRIASLMELTQALRNCRTPFETLRAVRHGMVEAFGSKAWILLSTRGERDGEYRVVQMLLGGRDVDGADPWTSQEFPLYRGGVIGAIIRNSVPQVLHDVDWGNDPHFCETLAGYGAMLAIPLWGASLPMTWLLLLKRAPARFTTEELERAVLRSAIVTSLLESKALASELSRAHQQLDTDARKLGDLQRSLLPQPLPQIPGLEIAASYEPCGLAGGDLYDVFPLEDGASPPHWCLFIGDASGHGLAAATVMAMVQSILHAHPAGISGPADLLAHANRHLCSKGIGGFVTAFLAIYEPSNRRLTYACAGHPPPLAKSSTTDGILCLDGVGSCPLGINADETFEEATVYVRPGDTVLLYTDGITEAQNLRGDMFSEQQLRLALRKCRDGPTATTVDHLERLVARYRQGQAPRDDQTLLAIRGIE
jgi:sigma-B regulation protein RsbU (phosphoserine phosphatase)